MKHALTFAAAAFLGALRFEACTNDSSRVIEPTTISSPSYDSLTITLLQANLYQSLYSTVPCGSAGWSTQLILELVNQNSNGSLQGIHIWQAVVMLSDTQSFVFPLSTSWNGNILAQQRDTVRLSSTVSRPCKDNIFTGRQVSMLLLWSDTTTTRRYFPIDSIEVSPIVLPY